MSLKDKLAKLEALKNKQAKPERLEDPLELAITALSDKLNIAFRGPSWPEDVPLPRMVWKRRLPYPCIYCKAIYMDELGGIQGNRVLKAVTCVNTTNTRANMHCKVC